MAEVRTSKVLTTPKGTPYLIEPEVVLVAKTTDAVHSLGVREFLQDYDETWDNYLMESRADLTDMEMLTKFAGQLCYLAFAQGQHTPNNKAQQYFDRIKAERHGSVLEHASMSFLCYGISRSLTHELVRHRAGFGFSQVSQRYVHLVRFVERPVFLKHTALHNLFLERIDNTIESYHDALAHLAAYYPQMVSESNTEYRKRLRQEARSVLTNEVEAPILVTANIRAWRHFIELRASEHAEEEIRALAMDIYYNCVAEAPMLFSDYRVVELPDGSEAVETEYRKV